MNNETLKKLHEAELEILDEIVRVCDENNIKYFIMFGTLLGAVRHKGFIPWDDDIDIAMMREDYIKFLEIAPKKLRPKFFLDNIDNNKKWYLHFSKVKNKNTIFEEEASVGFDGAKNIFVDIFPIDFINDDHFSKKVIFKEKIVAFLSSIMRTKTFNRVESKKALFASKFISNETAIKLINKVCISKKRTDNVVYYSWHLSNCFLAPYNYFFPLKKIEFEGKKYYAPGNYKNVLTHLYGEDYMELPPVEKRRTHKPIKIKFEDD